MALDIRNRVDALRVPLYDRGSNWAYVVMAALERNLKSWYGMMRHRISHRRVA